MKTVNKFEDIQSLPMPDGVKAKLLEHLIEPFGDEESTNAFWDEVGTTLYLIEEGDTNEKLNEESEEDLHFLRFVTNYPEWVLLLLNDDECPWLLAVAIVTMEGGGVYCCAPMNSPTFPVAKLADQAES
ncbi:hypothetical protein WJ038_13740 [Vibrio parahaemolyticus]|uniref:hypothetical protein n=2 Tax=Vibrio parahaemolyticus TaxID=670 RepID=UPI00040FE77A|nr:hypothetical protein [Vibrio parahaemolyticus]AMG06263.1 hypothetical protein AL464_05350 [Vibrio parahaemolyticus]EGR0427787.1 hypothetical protein [Vibrio parahaemolyticus]EJG0785513.1 hypothetical protein [Vibrio parahaemolyticus]EJG1592226.1 hypothetical protein [Vibrio parahaemolyticus]KKI07929.1 hypothetical protein WU75_18000 [Vibrio parahaemolyticus]